MRKNYLLLLLFIFVISLPIVGKAQHWEWLKTNTFFHKNMVNDDAGNIYFQNVNDFRDLTQYNFEDTSGKQISIKSNRKGIYKLNPEGKLKWFTEIKKDSLDTISNNQFYLQTSFLISKVKPGHIVVIGSTFRTILFDSIKLSVPSNSKNAESFIAVCDDNGKWISANFLGINNFNINGTDNIVEDKNGFIYFTLTFYQKLEVKNFATYKSNLLCLWIGKVDLNGNIIWGKSINERESNPIQAPVLSIDYNNNIIITGGTHTEEYDISGTIKILIYFKFIHKYSNDGNLLYKTEFRGNNLTFYAKKDQIDKEGNIFLAGTYKDSVIFDKTRFLTGGPNIFLAKYDSTLKLIWAKKSSQSIIQNPYNTYTIDDSGNIYIGGTSPKDLTFDSIKIAQKSTAYIFKFNKDGIAKWAYAAKPLNYAFTYQLHIDDCGNILSRGTYGGFDTLKSGNNTNITYIRFDHLYTQSNRSLNPNNISDYYLAKYTQNPIKIIYKTHCAFDSLEAEAGPKYLSFTWQFSDGKILKGKKIAYNPANAGWYQVKLTAVTAKGCEKHLSDSFYFSKPFTADDKLQFYYATVTSSNRIKIAIKPIQPEQIYYIYKSQLGNNFQFITKTKDTIFTDSSVDCSKYSYTYKLTAFDRCDKILESDYYAKTILLQGENHNNQYAEIKWSPYEIWQNGVKEYCIEIKDTSGNWNALSCNQNNNLALRDDDFVDVNQNERCYRIRALENNGNNQLSLSNELCLPYIPTIWIPNAFSPNNDGLNDTFKILTIALAEYKLTIYNRWGQQVFTSDDLNKNWTGKSGNENLPEGEYIYVLQAKGFNKENIYKQGYILLIR